MSESFESRRAPEPVGAFPHAKRVGNFLFLSGIGPRVRGSKEIPGVTLDSDGNILRSNAVRFLKTSGSFWKTPMQVGTTLSTSPFS